MACVRPRKNKAGKIIGYQAIIRLNDGFPKESKVLPTKQEAKDWAKQKEAERRLGCYLPNQYRKHTLAMLIDRYVAIILPTHPKMHTILSVISIGGKTNLELMDSIISHQS